jgi:tetratricopeptide (TPR) repeat protein
MHAAPAKNKRPDARQRTRLLAAIAQHQGGNVSGAVAGYREVLKHDPVSFDALRLLGAALMAGQDFSAAIVQFDRALAVRGNLAEVWALRGESLARMDQHPAAAASFERALALQPGDPTQFNNLGLQYQILERFDEALVAFDGALAVAPGVAVLWANRANVLGLLGRHDEAADSNARALSLDASVPAIWCNQGKALLDLGKAQEAIDCYERALALAPGLPQALTGRAAALRALGRLGAAIEDGECALRGNPRDPAVLALLGALYADAGRTVEALDHFDRALVTNPDNAETRFNRSLALLSLGRFAEGWTGYDARRQVARFSVGRIAGIPEWDGRADLAGRSLLLVCEQGLGDALQFARFVPLLAARGARIHLVARDALRGLFSQGLDGTQAVLGAGDPLPEADFQCPLLSVPNCLQRTGAAIPASVPYLRATRERIAAWRSSLELDASAGADTGLRRIGLVCSGNPGHANDRNRSIALEQFAHLIAFFRRFGWQWHLLHQQLGPADEAVLDQLGIVDHRAALGDFCDTAALATCMDAVVSVDTAVAHLTGALGRPLFLLLPFAADWRWMQDRGDSPWYPTARLIRQERAGDWESPLLRLRELLAAELPRQGMA